LRKLVTVTALVVYLTAAVASADAAPRKFFGTIGFNPPTAREFKRMGRGKVGTLRLNVYWSEIQGLGPAYYNWAPYDEVIGEAAENGIRVLPTIYGTPRWAANQLKYPPDAGHRDEFATFMKLASERYGSNGAFWALNPSIPRVPIIDWQLWNEPSSPSFWLPRPKAKSYKKLLVAAHNGLAAGDPNARLVLAGLFTNPNVRRGVPMVKYLNGLYRAHARKLFDAVAVHPYAATPDAVIDTVKLARKVMKRHKDGNKKIWITEVGWASSGRPSRFTVKPKVQAKYLRQTFKMAAKKRGKLRIAGVIWFSLKDQSPTVWVYRTGLFTRHDRPKPAWRSFVKFTHGQP
jgi:polysaccharide biosynthesis protein PslG